jgi:hypothetical protein
MPAFLEQVTTPARGFQLVADDIRQRRGDLGRKVAGQLGPRAGGHRQETPNRGTFL